MAKPNENISIFFNLYIWIWVYWSDPKPFFLTLRGTLVVADESRGLIGVEVLGISLDYYWEKLKSLLFRALIGKLSLSASFYGGKLHFPTEDE